MERLYVRVGRERMEIDPKLVEKYGLHPGTRLPFTGLPIEDEAGCRADDASEERTDEGVGSAVQSSEFVTLENGLTLSQSEILDFADGRDNSPQDEQ